jgi:hypothetical protein
MENEQKHQGLYYRFGEGSIILQSCTVDEEGWEGIGLGIRPTATPRPDLIGQDVPEDHPGFRAVGYSSYGEPGEVTLWFKDKRSMDALLQFLAEIRAELPDNA